MGKKRNQVYLQRWLAFHPYSSPVQSDYYYLKLSNEILGVLEEHWDLHLHFNLNDGQLKELACFLTGYFEDVISGPGLWKAFTTQVMELYGTFLPFFDPDPEEYLPDEINLEDIRFLLWYYISMVRYDEIIVSPFFLKESILPEDILEILEREYEQAPENERLKAVFAPPPEMDDFDVLIDSIRWIMLDSWLLHFGGNELNGMLDQEFTEEEEDPLPEDTREVYIADMADTYVMNSFTPLMARQGKDWLAHVLGKDHKLFDACRGMGEKKSGFYLYMGQEEDVLLFRHIASETVLRVDSGSFNMQGEWIAGESKYYGAFVMWRGMYWLLGSLLSLESGDTAAEEERSDPSARGLFMDEQADQSRDLKEQYQMFLEYTGGKALVFVESPEKAGEFIRDFLMFHNESVNLPDNVKDERNELIIKAELDRNPFPDTDPDTGEPIPGMVFFNPDSGFETAFGYNVLIPDPDNPWYIPPETGYDPEDDLAGDPDDDFDDDLAYDPDDDQGDDDDGMDSTRLLYSLYISGWWMHYLAEHYEFPGLNFPGEEGEELMKENFDFMLRFWKRRHYHFGIKREGND